MKFKMIDLIDTSCGKVTLNSDGRIYFHVKGKNGTSKYNRRRIIFLEQVNGRKFRSQLKDRLKEFNFRNDNKIVNKIIMIINNDDHGVFDIKEIIEHKISVKLLKEYLLNIEEYEINILNEEAVIINEGIWCVLDIGFDNDFEICNIFTGDIKIIYAEEMDKLEKIIITEDFILKNFIINKYQRG